MVTRESPTRTRLLASALLVLTFIVGALAGVTTDRAFYSNVPDTLQARPRTGGRGDRSTTRRQPSVFFQAGVFDSLSATTEQRRAIEAILARRDREANALYDQIKPSLDSMRRRTWGEMKAQLTPEQLATLNRIMKERRERWRNDRQHNPDNNKPRP
jgi:Spy/CpxP family protein refolding chaperone